MENIKTHLLPEKFYHIYNRGNDSSNIFFDEKNYIYFLKKYDHYLSDYLTTYAYCLMPNHFHLLVKIRPVEVIKTAMNLDNFPSFDNCESLERFISKAVSNQFRLLFMSYSKAINKSLERKGSLFQKYFRRIEVNNEKYFSQLVYYIHRNPQHHGFVQDFRNYYWSSYDRILQPTTTKLAKKEVLNWFGNKDEYSAFHNRPYDTKLIDEISLE
jgi:REP element-mobilizing transposase RayT